MTKQKVFVQAFGLSMCILVPILNYHKYSLCLTTKYLKAKTGVTSFIWDGENLLFFPNLVKFLV